jgi:hypothetical protein
MWRRDNSFGFKFDKSLNDFNSTDLQEALDEARISGREFNRETVLEELANKPSDSVAKDDEGTP